MQIDSTTYSINETNRYKNQSVKTQILLATSLRKSNYHIVRLQHKEFGKTKKWNTYTISREGIVYEHFDSKYHSDFLGIKEVDNQSISIVMENMGCLFKTQNDKYINWLNEVCDEKDVIKKQWLGYDYWERISEEQIKSVAELCKELCVKHGIPKQCIEFHHYHKGISKYRGILFRSNYIEDSSDINPLFDIEKFNEMLSDDEVDK